jgi:hypothetical protein
LISVDCMKSQQLALNILIDLYNRGLESIVTFNFTESTIKPEKAESKASRQLMEDYLDWLPDHFNNHNCDLVKLQKLEITTWIEFDNAFTPPRMSDMIQFDFHARTKWKADDKEEQAFEIYQTEIVNRYSYKLNLIK